MAQESKVVGMEHTSNNNVTLYLVAILLGILTLIVLHFHNAYKYWQKKGAPFLKPSFLKGNLKTIMLEKTTFGTETKQWYEELKSQGHKFGGIWLGSRPAFVFVDPDYIKDILSKDFNHFVERFVFSDEKNDPFSSQLFTAKNDSWKNLRQKLSPTFTSGKMKMMFDIVVSCSDNMVEYLTTVVEKGQDINVKEVMASFSTDVIGNVAYGLECNSFKESHAEFRRIARTALALPGITRKLKAAAAEHFPTLSGMLGIRRSIPEVVEFFTEIVRDTVNYREVNNITRPDFLQLLIDLMKKTESEENPFTFDQIVSNVFLFFIAGFDTSSTAMTFVLYELARNPEIQEKVRNEIKTVLANNDGKITYDNLGEFKYLTQAIEESLRMYPPVTSVGRVCTKDYTLRDTDIVIEKGTPVAVPLMGLHMDPEYFPEPEKFDPDRFSPENKAKRLPYAYLPFGEGQRNCIGLRFGMMQTRIGLVKILSNFEIIQGPRTKPLTIAENEILIKTRDTLYLIGRKLDK